MNRPSLMALLFLLLASSIICQGFASKLRLVEPILLRTFWVKVAYHQKTVAREPIVGSAQDVPVGKVQEPSRQKLKLPLVDPRIVVTKSERKLELFSAGALVRTYKIGLGLNPVPDKQREGDRATPEGEFYIFVKNPKSAFHLSLGVSYPNIEDAGRGLKDGLITQAQHDSIVRAIRRKQAPPQYTALGGLIYIHGNGASTDWTWGCVALENEDVEELYRVIPVGTPVTIKP